MIRPPRITVPKGEYASRPVRGKQARGIMTTMVIKEVIRIGRSRRGQARTIA